MALLADAVIAAQVQAAWPQVIARVRGLRGSRVRWDGETLLVRVNSDSAEYLEERIEGVLAELGFGELRVEVQRHG